MATTLQLPPRSESKPRSSPAHKPLSCTNCRQRKVKCNREVPCDLCLKYGLKCVLPVRRLRPSRNRPDGVDTRDEELLDRVRRLEAMLAERVERAPARSESGQSNSNQSSILGVSVDESGNPEGFVQGGNTAQNRFASFVKRQSDSSRHLSSEFWSSLSSEFDCLRELIQGNVDTDDEQDDSICQDSEEADRSSALLFYGPESFGGTQTPYPSRAQNDTLLQFYFSNVDPVCKVVHRPTTYAYYSDFESLLDPMTRRFKFGSLEASAFAMYFAAVVSMSPQECIILLGERKDVLVARYRRGTEAALVRVNFLSSVELTTLQAFVIYIVVQLSLDRGRHVWTLIGLATRIAHGIGLHRDADGRAFSAFEAEMRRRVWWRILALDMRASEARGSEVATGISYNTLIPCNLNDEDFDIDSQHPLRGKTCPTEITISLLGMDALWTSRKISFRSPADDPCLVPEQKGGPVKEFVKRVETTYLANCDFSDEKSKLLRTISHYWIYKLLLNLHYPLQQRMPYTAHCGAKGLQLAILFLTVNEEIEQHPSAAGLAWHYKSYVPWHALAVVLAELISQPEGRHTDRAWEIIDRRFQDWDSRVADVKEAMLWGLIKKLLKRARAAREQNQEVSRFTRLGLSNIDPVLQDVGMQGTPSHTQLGVLPLMDEPLDFLEDNTSGGIDPLLNNAAENPHCWNDFTSDFSALGAEFGSGMYD